MTLSNKEKAVILVANAIAVYSISTENVSLPKNQSLFDFIVKEYFSMFLFPKKFVLLPSDKIK